MGCVVNPRRLVFLVTWLFGKPIKVASPSPQKISHIRKPCEAKLFGGVDISEYLCLHNSLINLKLMKKTALILMVMLTVSTNINSKQIIQL
jgi:hypothetical protein